MGRYVVTGAAGFIGSHIVDSLIKRGHSVLAIDDESGGSFSNIESGDYHPLYVLKQDCADYEGMRKAVNTYRPDTLVHCAANAREGASQFQPYSVTQRNLLAYMATLSACIGIGIKKVVLFSSMSVYGGQTPPFCEEMSSAPVDVYGVNKAGMEASTVILSDVHGFQYAIIRPHNVFGERQCLTDIHRNVAAIFMNRIMREEPLFIYGDGEQKRAFSYIYDSLPSFMRVIENVGEFHGEVFNVGGKEEITVNSLAASVCAAMGVDKGYPCEYLDDRPREVKNAFCTYAKSVNHLGYSESIGWKRGIEYMATWAKRQGPQEWATTDVLEIVNAKTPKPWVRAV